VLFKTLIAAMTRVVNADLQCGVIHGAWSWCCTRQDANCIQTRNTRSEGTSTSSAAAQCRPEDLQVIDVKITPFICTFPDRTMFRTW